MDERYGLGLGATRGVVEFHQIVAERIVQQLRVLVREQTAQIDLEIKSNERKVERLLRF